METRLPALEIEAVRCCFQHNGLDEQFYALAKTLLWRNPGLRKFFDNHANIPAASQRAFATVAMLDLQIPNGGLMQFFWNCPDWVDDVPASLRAIGFEALADVFERSTADLIAQFGKFSEFRKRDTLAAYSECAGKFNFDEFDSAYHDLGEQVYVKSIAFVSQRLADFVASPQGV